MPLEGASIFSPMWGNEGRAALNWKTSEQGIEAKTKLETSEESLVGFF